MGQRCLPYAAVILAAGQSSRMGTPKQLLPYQGQSLLGDTIDRAREAGFAPIVVVLGSGAEAVRAAVAMKPVDIVENTNWLAGMGSSIAAGMEALLQKDAEDVGGVAVLLSDQPLVSTQRLIEMQSTLNRSSAVAIAAEYGGSLGVPALFRRALFRRLVGLAPQSGAKALLSDLGNQALRFPLPEAGADIDTPEDWAALGLSLPAERQR